MWLLFAELETQCRRLEVSLGLRDHMLSQAWNTLSGGERQRAAISCALILATSMPAWELQLQGASSETSAEASPVYHQREVQHVRDQPFSSCVCLHNIFIVFIIVFIFLLLLLVVLLSLLFFHY